MEVFNKSVNNTIQFILCLQDCCDNYRKSIELLWQQQYASFVREWKQNQIAQKQKKQTENNIENNSLKDLKNINTCPDTLEKLEELALADSLLEKARNIRMKNQKVVNGLIGKSISTPSVKVGAFIPKGTSSNQSSDKNKIIRKLPQSKSDFMLQNHKNAIVPRSKSATLSLVPNDSTKYYHKAKSSASPSLKSFKTSIDLPVISSKDLNRLKKLSVHLPGETNSEKNNFCSDSSGNKAENQSLLHPSSKEIISKIKGMLDIVSSDITVKLWYPFLSSKSEIFLTTVKCKTSCSVKKTCSVLYGIQETMMWIDLLHLIEKEIYPNIVFEANDVNMLRTCSYLLSIFHENSQRIPILDPNK